MSEDHVEQHAPERFVDDPDKRCERGHVMRRFQISTGTAWYCPVDHGSAPTCPTCKSANVEPFKVGFGVVKKHCWACGNVW